MKKNKIKVTSIACSLLLLSVTALQCQSPKKFEVNGNAIEVEKFDAEIEKLINEVHVPGLSLAIIENDEVVYAKNYGLKSLDDKEPVDDETIFEAASLSKSFLLLPVYQLVDEGKIDLDKPIYEYYPHDRLEYDERYKLITPRMILSHSSGIENWQSNHNQDTLEIIADPGTAYVYSGEGYNYLAAVLREMLGESVEEYMQRTVYQPLELKRTFSFYSEDGATPDNHAYGHSEFGDQREKWKNDGPIPSSGINTIAGDYAKAMVALFNGKHISRKRVGDIIAPMISIGDQYDRLYYGAGFEVLHREKDTIVFQGGSNSGWKGQSCYSVVNKRGFVMMTNGDRGKLMTEKINQMTVGLDISGYFEGDVVSQYPSIACTLFDAYMKEDSTGLFTKLDNLVTEGKEEIGENTLNELSYMFRQKSPEIAKQLARKNIEVYPNSSSAYWLLGKFSFGEEKHQEAYDYLVKARDLDFPDKAWINYDIASLEKILSQKDSEEQN